MSAIRAGKTRTDASGLFGLEPWYVREMDVEKIAKRFGVDVFQDLGFDSHSDGICVAYAEYKGKPIFGEHTSPSDAMLVVINQIQDIILGLKC